MAGFVNNVLFNPTLGGTTDWVVDTAVQGYNTPAGAGAVNGRPYKYRAESADLSQWEIGEGVYTVGSTTLARTTVLLNSAGTTAKINFSTVPQVGIIALAEDLLGIDQANSWTDAQKAQARSNIGAGVAFSAHKNATNQTGVPANNASAVKITFGTEVFDIGGYYDAANSRWTPPAGIIHLTVSAYLSVNSVDQAQSLLAIYKNGALYKYVAISNASGALGTVLNGSCTDEANGTDYYEAWFNKGGAGDGTIGGGTAYTWFQGSIL